MTSQQPALGKVLRPARETLDDMTKALMSSDVSAFLLNDDLEGTTVWKKQHSQAAVFGAW